MHYELKGGVFPVAVFTDNGFTVGKKEYRYQDVRQVTQTMKASVMNGGAFQILLADNTKVSVHYNYNISDDGDAALAFVQKVAEKNRNGENDYFAESVENSAIEVNNELTSAESIYEYCASYGYGTGFSKPWALNHFQVLLDSLMSGERIIFPFIGLYDYEVMKTNTNYACAVTDRRIIVAQKKVIGKTVISVDLHNVNDITFSSTTMMGIVLIDTYKETIKIGLQRGSAERVSQRLLEVFYDMKHPAAETEVRPSRSLADPYEELKKVKELFDAGVLTEEEFAAKKKQLLGL